MLSQCARTMGRLLMPPLLGEGRWALSDHATTQVTVDFSSCGFPHPPARGRARAARPEDTCPRASLPTTSHRHADTRESEPRSQDVLKRLLLMSFSHLPPCRGGGASEGGSSESATKGRKCATLSPLTVIRSGRGSGLGCSEERGAEGRRLGAGPLGRAGAGVGHAPESDSM